MEDWINEWAKINSFFGFASGKENWGEDHQAKKKKISENRKLWILHIKILLFESNYIPLHIIHFSIQMFIMALPDRY